MGTGATLLLQNSLDGPLHSQVSDITCMYSNGKDGSHLEYFNCDLNPNQSVGPQYIEANGNVFSGCASTQSSFTLNLSSRDGQGNLLPLGQVAIEIGSGAYNTAIVGNSDPVQIVTNIDGNRGISVQARPVPPIVQFANSWLWANMSAIQGEFSLPPVSLGPLSFGAGALQGLDQITAVDGEITGNAGGTVEVALHFTVPQLLTAASISFEGATVQGGIQLTNAQLSASVAVVIGPPMRVTMTALRLDGGDVSLNAGGLPIPVFVLTGLLGLVETAFNNDPIQSAVLAEINKHLPGNS